MDGMTCVNTDGSYHCECPNLTSAHHPVPEFNQTFHYGLRSRRHVEESVKNTLPETQRVDLI